MAPALLILFVLLAMAGCSPAATDRGVARSDPPDGAALSAAPTAVELTVAARPEVARSHISVSTGDGAPLAAGPLTRSGELTLRQPVSIGGTGDFTIAYHVVLAGGGDVSGVRRFSVGTGIAPATRGGPQDAAAPHHQIDNLSAVLLVLNGVVVIGFVAALLATKPRRRIVDDDPAS